MKRKTGIWRNRDFLVMWIGLLQSHLGDVFLAIGGMWLIYEITGSAMGASTALLLQGIPKLFGPLTGAYIDRANKKRLLIWCDVIRGLFLLLLFVLAAANALTVIIIYVMIFALSAVSIVYDPSVQVVLPQIVAEEDLPAANSLVQVGGQVANILGASAAALALAHWGAASAFLIDALTFLMAGLLLILVKIPETVSRTAETINGKLIWNDMREGFRKILGSTEIMILVLLTFMLNLVLGPVNVVFPVFAEKVLGGGVEAFGLLISALSAGTMAGGLVAGFVARRIGSLNREFMIGFALMIGALIGLSFSTGVEPAVVAAGLLGVSVPFLQIPLITWLQSRVPAEFQGRVFSTLGAVSSLGVPLGAILAGILLASASVSLAFQLGAVGIGAVATCWLIWQLRQPRVLPPSADLNVDLRETNAHS